ncbi:MAG TPA: hypothetical protein VEQ41_10070 [Solirubrobacterales bacterium]|nr:hypothetical protein [Solirubrobacterales bacterium]
MKIPARIKEWPWWLLLAGLLALAFYAVNAAHYGQLPLRIEEGEWPPMAEAVYETAEPTIEAGETRRIRFEEDLSVDESPFVGAWHPPLYIYAIGVATAFVGTDSPQALRGVGALGLLAAALLLILIAREVTPRWRLVGGVAAILLLLHPFAIQGSLFLDIDNSIYAPLALLAIWLAIRYGQREAPLSGGQILAIGAALALVTWAKMTSTTVLIAAIVLWWLLSRRPPRRAALECAAFLAVGAILFTSTYGLWCVVTGIPFSYTFDVTFAGKSNRLLSEWWLVENAVHWHLRWLGPAVILLTLVYAVDMVRRFAAERKPHPLDLPFLFAVGVLIFYVGLSPTDGTYQGKYAIPALVALLLPLSWLLLREPRPLGRPALWAAAVAVGVVAALVMPDLLTGLAFGGYGSWGYDLKVTALAGAALGLAWLLGGRAGFGGGVIVVLAVLLIAQAARSYDAETSPLYPVPDTGDFRAVLHDLNEDTGPRDVVVVPKDVGFYVDRLIVEGEDALARGDERLARAIRHYPRITAFARDSFGPPIGPATQAVLERCFRDERVYGTAVVMHRTSRCARP